MPKEEGIPLEGIIEEAYPNGVFLVRITTEGFAEKEMTVLAHVGGKMKKYNIRLLPGDKVKLEVSPYDFTKGRILYREKE